jgi:UDP-2,3-diacylglucosamine hydrolase
VSILFISDVHLSCERPDIVRAFLDFLDQRAIAAKALYILGDLFEAWIGDDDTSKVPSVVKHGLRSLSDHGVNIFIQHGNRDFLLGQKFMQETGSTLLPDEYIFDGYGYSALLMHGDSLCTDDQDYQRFRRKSRHPVYKWILSNMPLRYRQNLASKWRQQSADANSRKTESIMDVNQQTIATVTEKYQITRLIHGHTHRPCIHQTSALERIVLGDWYDMGWCLTLNEEGFKQDSWPIL